MFAYIQVSKFVFHLAYTRAETENIVATSGSNLQIVNSFLGKLDRVLITVFCLVFQIIVGIGLRKVCI